MRGQQGGTMSRDEGRDDNQQGGMKGDEANSQQGKANERE